MMVEDAYTMPKAWAFIVEHDRIALDKAVAAGVKPSPKAETLCRCSKCTALMAMLCENGFFDAKRVVYDVPEGA